MFIQSFIFSQAPFPGQNTHDSSRATGAADSGSGKLAPKKLLSSGLPTERACSHRAQARSGCLAASGTLQAFL